MPLLNEGDEVVMADPTFPVYTNVTQIMVERLSSEVEKTTLMILCMLRKVNQKTKLVFVCNPNNPTGTTVSQDPSTNFSTNFHARVIVILDEAYGDFSKMLFIRMASTMSKVRGDDRPSNFSKVYG